MLLTGTYPLTNRTPSNDLRMPADVTSIAHALAPAGYRCGYIGKWHSFAV